MHDIIIIGAGPAGISAGLYAKRSNMDVLILYCGKSNLEEATQIDNYYGFEKGISGKQLYNNGLEQAKNIGISLKNEETLDITINQDNTFNVTTTANEYKTKSIVLSTGNKKVKPNIYGISEFEGKGISYCAICDGFFYKNKDVAVIGNGNYAVSEAEKLQGIANNVTILTNGLEKPNQDVFSVDTRIIKQIKGNEKVEEIVFEDGSILKTDGVFIALGEAGGFDFAKKLGILLKNNNIIVNEKMETNIPGIYACGNITGGLLQISKAVYEGMQAGINASQYIKNN